MLFRIKYISKLHGSRVHVHLDYTGLEAEGPSTLTLTFVPWKQKGCCIYAKYLSVAICYVAIFINHKI